MQASPLNIPEEEAITQEKILHASGIIAAGKGKIKIRQAMKLVGFTAEVKNMTLYQKVRRKAMNICVVEKASLPKAPQQIGDGAETVASALSSADRTDQEPSVSGETLAFIGRVRSTTEDVAEDGTVNTERTAAAPRRLLDSTPSVGSKRSAVAVTGTPKKKHRRSSGEAHGEQANVIMKTNKESQAMKLAAVRIAHNKALPPGHPDKKSTNEIVKAVNVLCNSNTSPKTAGAYARKGLVDTSPLKRGPCGEFSKAVFASLKGAYSTFLMLEQAESKKQSSIKEMALPRQWLCQCCRSCKGKG